MYITRKKIGNKKQTKVAYWRKFNALHGWFVNKIQDGVDNCEAHPLKRADLVCLLNTLHTVSDTHDQNLMPPRGGCFSGNTIDEDIYFDNVERSIPVVQDLIFNTDWQNAKLYYRSCW